MSPKPSLRSDYSRYLYIGLLVAVLLHAAAFAFWPKYVPSVYKLPAEITKIIDIMPEYELPPPPAEIAPPVELADLVESDDADPMQTIGPNFVNLKDLPPLPPPPLMMEPSRHLGFDTPPEVIRTVKPVYPDIARKAEVEGRVTVIVTIDEAGRVIAATVAHSDASILDQAALDAAFKYSFRPAEQNGFPVKASISIKFRFVLRE